MLIIGTISCGKADLRQRIVKPGFFRDLRQPAVVFSIPAGALGIWLITSPPETLGTQ